PTYRGTTEVEAITAGGPGFVAVGAGGQQLRGRVWTSADGLSWSAAPDEQFVGYRLRHVVRAGDPLFAFGRDQRGTRVWRSSEGREWTSLPEASELVGAGVNDVTVVEGTLLAVGFSEDPEYGGAVWRSTDGGDWQRVAAPQEDVELWAVATLGTTLVGIERDPFGLPSVHFSDDLGDSWQPAQVDFVFGEDGGSLVDVAADGRRFVAVGYADSLYYPPIAARSGDGTNWNSRRPAGVDLLGQVVALRGGGFLALEGGGMRALISGNGRDWTEIAPLRTDRPAPPLPPEIGDEVVTFRALAANRSGVVVAQPWGDGVVVLFGPQALFGR
ncbi:MAG TPA: hypothetical protein VMP67_09140, partial [Candidatus Limnocylindria bacterium]|nr:hypothetical protein [Candidatus Limnocylindria bacterium]